MEGFFLDEDIKKIDKFNGISIFNVKSDKFKTNTINIFFIDNLSKETVAKNTLLLSVLKKGTKKYPTSRAIQTYLESLYGANLGCGVYKKGESHILQFYIDTIKDKFTLDLENQSLFDKAFELLLSIILEPYFENGTFKQEYIDLERNNLIKFIEGKINDKMYYSIQKCIEEMCKNEAFGIYEYGELDDYKDITTIDILENYKRILKNLPMYIFISGDIDERVILEKVKKLREIERGDILEVNTGNIKNNVIEERTFIEKLNITQDKLCMGFRSNIEPNSSEYISLMVFNSILGGGMHSKLFQNIREKSSLCYYIFSNLDRYKGLMFIATGIENRNKERVRAMILTEINNIRDGNISEYELISAKKSIKTGLNSLRDNQLGILDFYLSQIVLKSDLSLDKFISAIGNVTREDVVAVSEKIVLDTEYILTSI